MNGIKSFSEARQIKAVAQEIVESSGFKKVKDVVMTPVERKVPTIGRDLINQAGHSSEIRTCDLLNRGYNLGGGGIVFKVDRKNGIYKGVQFDGNAVTNITISDTLGRQKNVVTTRMANGSWISIGDHGRSVSKFNAATSEQAAKKATELKYDGYELVADGETRMKFKKGDSSITISKETGNVIE